MKKTFISSKKITFLAFLVFAVPLLLLLLLFDFYTIQKQTFQSTSAFSALLIPYRNAMENALGNSEEFLADTISNDINLQAMYYAKTKTDTHLAAMNIVPTCRAILKAEPLIGEFALYSGKYDYYYPVYNYNYPLEDQQTIKRYVQASKNRGNRRGWTDVSLSDRIVLIRTLTFENIVCAAVVDPSLDSAIQNDQEANNQILFYMSKTGTLFTPSSGPLSLEKKTYSGGWQIVTANDKRHYLLVKAAIPNTDMLLVHASLYRTFWEQLDLLQMTMIAASIFMALLIPVCWSVLKRMLFQPMQKLTETMQNIEQTGFDACTPECSNIYEVRQFSHTFNLMIRQIRHLKIISYERKLEMQQAQLQYLQLQIRPHFFISCLKVLYGLAEQKQYHSIQDMILALSDYLRYTFKDITKLVPLSMELHSVQNYIGLQNFSTPHPPALSLDIAADTTDLPVPPLSLLTFVENALKHTKNVTGLTQIEIKSDILSSQEGNFLNLTVRDNGGGFTKEQLGTLNKDVPRLYTANHVGVSNVRQRLHLIYGDAATLAFTNGKDGGCVDLYIPILENNDSGSENQ